MKSIFILLVISGMLGLGTAMARSSGAIHILHGSIAQEGNSDHPKGCLPGSPKVVKVSGTLGTTTYPGDPGENPPIPKRTSVFLWTRKPISTCAIIESKNEKIPSYVNVRKISLGWWSIKTARYAIKKWGGYEVKIFGTLGNAGLTGGAPGNVMFWKIMKFCVRRPYQNYKCMNLNAIAEELH